MTSPDSEQDHRGLTREWAAARVVLGIGFALALAVCGYFIYQAYEARHAAELASQPQQIDRKKLARAELAVCSAELIRARALGAVPEYGELASANLLHSGGMHFICAAQTHLTRYYISAELRCNNLGDAKCVSIDRVVLKDGTLVYARPQ
jgi:hypothetical protein